MITGFDTVVVTAQPPAQWLGRFLGAWQKRWPAMLVDHGGGAFHPWRGEFPEPVGDDGELVIIHDAEMESDWDENAYDSQNPELGPIGIMYQPCTAATFSAEATSDPYARDEDFGFEPYPVQVLGKGLFLVTLITPEASETLVNRAIEVLQGLTSKT